MDKFTDFCKKLEGKIIDSYESGITMPEAEKLAAEFLHAQLVVSAKLRESDLNSRMRKSGVKAIRAALYTEARSKADKVTEAALTALLDSNELVNTEQQSFDETEASRDELERLYNTFGNAHIYYRGIAKGSFGG